MKVSEIMTKEVFSVTPQANIRDLAKLLVDKNVSGAPVVDSSGKCIGIVLEESLIFQDKKVHLPTFIAFFTGYLTLGEKKFEAEMKRIAATSVEGIMEKDCLFISPEDSVEDVATMIIERNIHYYPVVKGNKLVGVVTKKDIVRAIAQGKVY
jgi:CBS domain-containing protein